MRIDFDFIVLPHTVRRNDIQQVRDVLGPQGSHIHVLAKISTLEGLRNFEEIVQCSDGIVLNRSELGLELPAEKLMIAQKWMISRVGTEGKPIFLESQILESMVESDQGNREEAEDITSAVLEGADSFILTNETTVGPNFAEAVIQLAKAIAEGENIIDYEKAYQDIKDETKSMEKKPAIDLLASTACSIALDNNVNVFICLTETGKIARYVAKYRPFQDILACSTSSAVVKQVNVCRGVIGYKVPSFISKYHLQKLFIEKQSERLINLVLKVAKDQGICQPGNKVLIFQTENEGQKNENITFKLQDIE